jgi:hypothetical protein
MWELFGVLVSSGSVLLLFIHTVFTLADRTLIPSASGRAGQLVVVAVLLLAYLMGVHDAHLSN